MTDSKITKAGIAAENKAIEEGKPLVIAKMLFGDGIKDDSIAAEDMTQLVKQVASYDCEIIQGKTNSNAIFATVYIPYDAGPYSINEIGLQLGDENKTLYTYGKNVGDIITPDTDSTKQSVNFTITIETANSDTTILTVSGETIYATFQDLDDHGHKGLLERKELSTEDLNDVVISGVYEQKDSGSSKPERNYPVEKRGVLIVAHDSQTYHSIGLTYTRTYFGEKWSTWGQHYTSANKPLKNDVGLGSVDNIASSITSNPNEIVRRSKHGDIFVSALNSTAFFTDYNNLSAVWVETTSDGFLRKQTVDDFKKSLELDSVKNHSITDDINSTLSALYASAKSVGLVNKKIDNIVLPTKISLELGNVGNYKISHSVNSISTETYASSKAVKTVNDALVIHDHDETYAYSSHEHGRLKETRGEISIEAVGARGQNGPWEWRSSIKFAIHSSLWVQGDIEHAKNIVAAGAVTAWRFTTSASDIRLKTNITPVKNSLDAVMSWDIIRYTYNDLANELSGLSTVEPEIGVKAHQIQLTTPEAVVLAALDDDGEGNSKSGENYLTVDYTRLVPQLIGAIQEQNKLIQDLTKRIEKLEETNG